MYGVVIQDVCVLMEDAGFVLLWNYSGGVKEKVNHMFAFSFAHFVELIVKNFHTKSPVLCSCFKLLHLVVDISSYQDVSGSNHLCQVLQIGEEINDQPFSLDISHFIFLGMEAGQKDLVSGRLGLSKKKDCSIFIKESQLCLPAVLQHPLRLLDHTVNCKFGCVHKDADKVGAANVDLVEAEVASWHIVLEVEPQPVQIGGRECVLSEDDVWQFLEGEQLAGDDLEFRPDLSCGCTDALLHPGGPQHLPRLVHRGAAQVGAQGGHLLHHARPCRNHETVLEMVSTGQWSSG